MENKSFGGYLGLELYQGKEYYSNAIAVNAGRNGLEYILRCRQYRKLFIPYFTCDAVLTPLRRLGVDYAFYRIDRHLEPIFDFNQLKADQALLYTNYFGLKSAYISTVLSHRQNIIVDNAQAFFAQPVYNLDTFYSPRKFFGVPDGGYVFLKNGMKIDIEQSHSYSSMDHLIKQLDVSTEFGFKDYQENELKISNAPLQKMSRLTKKILNAIDYDRVARNRRGNFDILDVELSLYNQLNGLKRSEAPLHYPLLIENDADVIRKLLLECKIYTPVYWLNVIDWIPDDKYFEVSLVKNTIHLPIDQRYGAEDMKHIASIVKKIIKSS